MSKPPINIGDIFEIPLPDGRKAFGQYIRADKGVGPVIQIYNFFVKNNETVDLKELVKKDLLFPPVLTGIYAAIRSKKWKIIGHLPVDNFAYPGFISTLTNPRTGEASTWYFWNGEQSIRLGKELPNEYKSLEYSTIYPSDFIVERIMTGKKPNEELIMTNKLPVPPLLTKEEKEKLSKMIRGGK